MRYAPSGRPVARLPMRHLLCATAALALVAVQGTAIAQAGTAGSATTRSFAIGAQPLASALQQFAEATGVQVGYAAALGAGARSPGASGSLSVREALSRLLAGTGLTYRFTSGNAVVIEAAPTASGDTVQLGTLRVGAGTDSNGGKGSGSAAALASAGTNRAYVTAGSSAYLSRETIQQNRGTSPGDFLRGIPGVLNGDNRNSGSLDVNIRGMQGMDRVPVVIDGSLQQSTVYRGYSGVAGRTYLDPDLIGSVTIEKGASAAADGVGATGGIVRVNTLMANDLIAPGKTTGVQIRFGLTGNNVSPPPVATQGTGAGTAERFDRPGLLNLKGINGSIAVAQRIGDLELVGAFARRKIGNYFGGEHGTVPPGGTSITGGVLQRYNLGEEVLSTSQNNTSILLRGVYRFGNGHGIDLAYTRYESDFGEMMPSQILRFGGALEAPLSRAEVNTYTARYRWKPANTDLINLKLDAWKTDSFTSIETLYRYAFPNGTVSVTDAAYQSQSDRWGINLSNQSALDTPLGRLALDYGASFNHEKLTPPKGWDTYKGNSGYTSFVEPRHGWRKEYSAFAAGELKPNDWVTLNASVRYTNTESQDKNLTDTYAGTPQVNVVGYNHEKNDGFAPIFSFLIEPVAGLQFYARYAEAIRNPSLFESTTGFSFYPDPRNPIRPEHARTTELGVNFQRGSLLREGDLLQTKFAFFSNDIDDYLTRGVSDGMTSIINIENARFKGLEASARYDTGTVFADVGASYYIDKLFCSSDHICREGGTSNSYIPAHLPPKFSLTANAGVRLLDERLVLGARYTYVGERDTPIVTFGGSTTTIDWTPYNLVDLYGSFDINEMLAVTLAVDNLTDRYYMDALTLGLMPSPGRTVRVGLTGRFGGPRRDPTRAARLAVADALAAKTPWAKFDGDWSGAYVGLQAGYDFLKTKGVTTAGNGTAGGIPATESAHSKIDGAAIGIFAGYNWKLGAHLVAGIEGDLSRTRGRTRQYARSTELTPILFDFYEQDRSSQADTLYAFDWMTTARARLGYAAGPALLYGTAGLAMVRETQKRTQYIDNATISYFNATRRFSSNSMPYFTEADRKTRLGWTAGGGAEFALGNHWSLRADYRYAKFGAKNFSFANARTGVGQSFTVAGAVLRDPVTNAILRDPVTNAILREMTSYTGTAASMNGRKARNDLDMQALTLGIAFRF